LRTALSKRSAWVSRGMCGGGAGFIFYTAMFRPSHRSFRELRVQPVPLTSSSFCHGRYCTLPCNSTRLRE
jgi:hypothetical protein